MGSAGTAYGSRHDRRTSPLPLCWCGCITVRVGKFRRCPVHGLVDGKSVIPHTDTRPVRWVPA